ncbi:class I SAM-dependent methyltransferase [Mycobacterium sp. C31M]
MTSVRVSPGPPPWDIGEPQPEFAGLIAAGKIRSDVLDAGCGSAELSLTLAAMGYTVVGLDISPTVIASANYAAQARNLRTASFAQADITSFAGYDGRFNTILDSALLHSLPEHGRDGYLRAARRAAAPGATLYVLTPDDLAEDALFRTVSAHWTVEEIRPAVIHANLSSDRTALPAYLLTARG